MASLGSLVVSLAMDTAKFSGDIGKAAQQMARLTAEAGKIGAAIGVSVGLGLRALGGLVKESIDAADAMSKMAVSVGMSTEEVSRLAYAADLAGVSQDELGASLSKLARQAADAAAGGKTAGDLFEAMGVKVKNVDGTLKTTTDLLGDVADQFASYREGTEKTALATELFGKSGARLIPFLNQGRAGLADLAEEADILGITLTTQAGTAAEQFNDNLTRLQAAQNGLGRQIAERLLPTITNLTDGLFNSAKNADLFGKAATIAATGVKLLVSGGAIIVGVFNTIGTALGGLAATLVALFSGRFADAFNIARETVFDFAGNVRGAASTVATIWDDTAGRVEAKAPTLGGKLAAPIVMAAEKARRAARVIQSEAEKAYADIEKRLGALKFDVDTQGMSERAKGLADLVRQGANQQQVQTYIALTEAQERFRAGVQTAADEQERQNAVTHDGYRVFMDTRTPLEAYLQQQRELGFLLKEGAIDQETYTRAVTKAATTYRDAVTETAEAAKDAADFAKDLGLTFESAFENAIVGGNGLRDVVKGLEQDLLRIITRQLVTKPLANSITGALSGGIAGLFGGGASAAPVGINGGAYLPNLLRGGAATGSNFIERDMFTILHKGEAVIPKEYNPAAGGRGAGMTVVQNFTVGPGTDRRTQQQLAAAAARGVSAASRRYN